MATDSDFLSITPQKLDAATVKLVTAAMSDPALAHVAKPAPAQEYPGVFFTALGMLFADELAGPFPPDTAELLARSQLRSAA